MAIITASDLKAHLNISDVVDDTSVTTAASAACAWVQKTCGRSFEVTTSGSESSRDFRPRTQLVLVCDDFSSTTNLTVKTDNGDDGTFETTLTLNTDYWVEPLNGIEDGLSVPYHRIMCTNWLFPMFGDNWLGRWPRRPSVRVTARWGWSAVPDAVKQAALIEGARLFKRRTSPEGVLGGFGDFGALRVTNREDPDALSLLAPYARSETALPV